MESEPKPRYRWQKTWDDRENDFIAFDGAETFARIYIHNMGSWMWFFNRHGYPGFSGWAETARMAAKGAEDYWDKVKAAKAVSLQREKVSP